MSTSGTGAETYGAIDEKRPVACACFYAVGERELIMYKCEVHWSLFGDVVRRDAAARVETASYYESRLDSALQAYAELKKMAKALIKYERYNHLKFPSGRTSGDLDLLADGYQKHIAELARAILSGPEETETAEHVHTSAEEEEV